MCARASASVSRSHRPGGGLPLNELLPDDVLLYDVPVRLLDDLLHGGIPLGSVRCPIME